MNRDELTPKQQAELDDKIFAAKKRAERAGYKVIMPGEGGATIPTQEPTAQTGKPTHTMSRQAYAQRVGGPANRLSMADRLSQLAQAAKTAEEAGYRVRKATPEERAALKAQQTTPAANPAPATAANPAPAPAATPAPETTPAAPPAEPPKPAEPENKPNPYFAAAARFCKQED